MDEFIGIVKLFAGTFAPRGWAMCNGALMSISQNTALFSILGVQYGGDGVTTFALPNLQGMVAIGAGSGGGSRYEPGQIGGTPNVSLTTQNLPAHNHVGGTVMVSSANATQSTPTLGAALAVPGTLNGRSFTPTLGYNTATTDVQLNAPLTTGITGSNTPVSVMQPYMAMNYIICTEGIFPPRS